MPRKKAIEVKETKKERARISQSDVPSYSIDDALDIPRAIVENYAGKPTKPLRVASALKVSPASSNFRYKCGASIAYGLTTGGYNADEIKLETLGKRILQPLNEDEDSNAKREAVLKPKIFRDFFRKYDSSLMPREDIALNVLQDMGVPKDRVKSVFDLILTNAQSVGFIHEIGSKKYVDLSGLSNIQDETETNQDTAIDKNPLDDISVKDTQFPPTTVTKEDDSQLNRRVYVSHGKNQTFIEPIKKLIEFGELIPVVSIEKQSVSLPAPDKVMQDMRSCGAGIIHVDQEEKITDEEGIEHIMINHNVLIEIGAAMALYGRRFILLVKEGLKVPSNLHGLYEVRYKGDVLNSEETIKLLEAIRDIKNHSLPDRKVKQEKQN